MSAILKRAVMDSKSNVRAASQAAVGGQKTDSLKLWKRLSLFVALPAVGLGMLNAYIAHAREHAKQTVRPEFKPYSYMRNRTKRFPWGDGNKSLFHNPRVNALPTGYED